MIPKVTVQELQPAPRPLQAVLQDYAPRGRSRRGGFWILKPCRICGSLFECRQKPNKPENIRCTCGPQCSNINARIGSTKWARENPEKARENARKKYDKKKARMEADPEFAEQVRAGQRKASKKWNKNNPGRRKEINQNWEQNNKEYRKAYQAHYYLKNKERLTERNKQWKADNPEVVKRIRDDFLARHPGYNAEYAKRRRQAQVPAQ